MHNEGNTLRKEACIALGMLTMLGSSHLLGWRLVEWFLGGALTK